MRRIGDEDYLPRITSLRQALANYAQACELSLGTGGWLQADPLHTGDFLEGFTKAPEQRQAALGEMIRSQGVHTRELREARDELAHFRIVLHGT